MLKTRKKEKLRKNLNFLFDNTKTISYNLTCLRHYAILAQLVEQLICNQQVVGSSPTNGSKTKTLENIAFQGFFFCLGNRQISNKRTEMVTIW